MAPTWNRGHGLCSGSSPPFIRAPPFAVPPKRPRHASHPWSRRAIPARRYAHFAESLTRDGPARHRRHRRSRLNVATGQFSTTPGSPCGTDLIAIHRRDRHHRLARVPVGPVTLGSSTPDSTRSGSPSRSPPDRASGRDVELTSAARYGAANGTVKLDAFTVSTTRETNNDAIAINEQRFAPTSRTSSRPTRNSAT